MTSTPPSQPTTSPPKPLIILVHGGASSSRMYNPILPHLPPTHYTVLTPDLPGHGTQFSTGPFTFTSAVTSITTYILSAAGPPGPSTRPKILLVGISLGGQAVLAFLQSKSELVDAALVSGVSINPPDENASWEMPHMPSDQATIDMMMEDVARAGMENMKGLQEESFAFTFDPDSNTDPAVSQEGESKKFPPVLVMVGEHDTAMSRRDFQELVRRCKRVNGGSEGVVLKGAWHNHSIDVPEEFAEVVKGWAGKIL